MLPAHSGLDLVNDEGLVSEDLVTLTLLDLLVRLIHTAGRGRGRAEAGQRHRVKRIASLTFIGIGLAGRSEAGWRMRMCKFHHFAHAIQPPADTKRSHGNQQVDEHDQHQHSIYGQHEHRQAAGQGVD